MIEAFYRDNYHIVYGYLLSLCADPTLAEDLASETFLKAVEYIDRYDPRFQPSTWLCTIGRNLYYNEVKRRKPLVSMDHLPEIATASAETLYLEREQAQRIIASAEKLPQIQRQVLYMRLQGMRFQEIGLALGKTENWARVTYFRSKSRILKEMEESV